MEFTFRVICLMKLPYIKIFLVLVFSKRRSRRGRRFELLLMCNWPMCLPFNNRKLHSYCTRSNNAIFRQVFPSGFYSSSSFSSSSFFFFFYFTAIISFLLLYYVYYYFHFIPWLTHDNG